MKVFELNTVSLNNLNTFKKREIVLKHLVKYGIQRVHTPFSLVNYMVPKDLPESICVMFNLEFLEILKFSRKYDMSKVTFFGDSEVEVLFAKKIYNVENSFLVNGETWEKLIKKEIDVKEVFMSKMKEAPDITFSNPPYDNKDLKILKPLIESNCFKRLICVHPCTWLTQTKTRFGFGGSKLFKDFRNLVKDHLRRVFFFNGNKVFNIGLNADCIISDFDFSVKRKDRLFVKFLEDKEFTNIFKSIDEITIHGKDFVNFESLIENLKEYIEKNGSLETKKIIFEEANKITSDKFLVQFMIMRANKISETNSNFFVMEQLKINKEKENGIKDNEINGVIIFSFNSKKEKENFLKTIKTDFMRLCLSILKFNSSIHFGELSFVPWLDWTKSYTDEELFTMFGIEKEHPLREYSKKIISDYWDIGKNY